MQNQLSSQPIANAQPKAKAIRYPNPIRDTQITYIDNQGSETQSLAKYLATYQIHIDLKAYIRRGYILEHIIKYAIQDDCYTYTFIFKGKPIDLDENPSDKALFIAKIMDYSKLFQDLDFIEWNSSLHTEPHGNHIIFSITGSGFFS